MISLSFDSAIRALKMEENPLNPSHQAAEPRKIPVTIGSKACWPPWSLAIPSLNAANIAINDKMVMGLDRVRNSVVE
ncbi:hypothetical protein D3C85_1775620 [compost metagenome]